VRLSHASDIFREAGAEQSTPAVRSILCAAQELSFFLPLGHLCSRCYSVSLDAFSDRHCLSAQFDLAL